MYKICSKCNIKQKLINFHLNCGRRRSDCKKCVSEYSRSYREKNKEIIKKKKKKYHIEKPYIKRRSYLKTEYGLSMEDYDKMFKLQKGKCKICKVSHPKNISHKHLYVDHCHKTGKIRGLLCRGCNFAIGEMEDNILFFKNAINYLKEKG